MAVPVPPVLVHEQQVTMSYSAAQLRELLRLARELGFQDDVAHWTSELNKLEEGSKNAG